MDDEDLDKNVTVYNKTEDEFYSVEELIISDEKSCDVVDEGHLLLVFNCICSDIKKQKKRSGVALRLKRATR